MDGLEFTQRLVKILTLKERQEILKKASMKGFTVNGFTKNLSKVPLNMMQKALERKRKDGKFYNIIILESIADLQKRNSKDFPIDPCDIAKLWLKGDAAQREYAIKLLIKLEENAKNEEQIKQAEKQKEEIIKKQEEVIKEQWTEPFLENLKEKNKKQQLTIQNQRITIEDQEKKITQLKKEYSKIEQSKEEIKQLYSKLENDYQQLETMVQEKEDKIKVLKEQIEGLKKYEQWIPRVLCFSKKEIDPNEIPYYKITTLSELDSQLQHNIVWKNYDEVWIITKDFSYYEIQEIMKFARYRVRKFFSVRKMKIILEEEKNELI